MIRRLEASEAYTNFQRSPAFVVVPLLALGVALGIEHGSATLGLAFGETALNVCIALIVHYAIRYPETPVGRLLNVRPLVYMGTLSYSLYLWQQIFLNRKEPQFYTAFPLNLALAVVCAVVSFHFIEQPFLRWRELLEPKIFGAKVKASAARPPA